MTSILTMSKKLVQFCSICFLTVFRDVHIMVFAGSGLLLCYMRHYGYSSIGLTFLYCSLALQWGTITTGLFGFISIAKERADLTPGDDMPPYKIAVGLSR